MRTRIFKHDNRLNLVLISLTSLLVIILIASSLIGLIPDKSNIKHPSVLADLQDQIEKTYNQLPSLGQGIDGVYPWIPKGPNNIYDFINDSGKISALSIDWSDTNIMYLGSGYGPSVSGPGGSGGVYKSINGGKSWTPVDYGLNNTIVDSLLINQNNPNVVIASTYTGGIYKTVDGGAHWYKTASYLMTFDFAAGGNVVYVPTYSGIAMSTNFGNSWSIVLSTNVPFFAVSTTANGSDVYSVDWNGNVYFSSDYGAHWKTVYHFNDVGLAWSITVEPWDSAVVYLAYIDFNNGSVPTLWKSQDSGTNWTSYPEFTPNSGFVARSVAFDNSNQSVFYIVGQGFAFKYNGTSFSSMSLGTDNRVVWTNPLNGTQVYVGSDQGLFYTANNGSSWRCISAPLNVSMLMDVAAANGGSELQVAVQDYAALYSLNNGTTWAGNYPCECNWPGEGGTVIVNPANSFIVYFYTSDVLKLSNTSGQSWMTIASFTPTQPGVYFPQGMTVNPRNPSTVYLATSSGVFYSTDWGYNWSVLSGSPKNATVVAMDPQNLSKIWVGTSDGLFFGNLTSKKWYSTGLTKGNFIDSIAIDPDNKSIVFVGTGLFSSGTILRSTNDGGSFVNIGSKLNINNGFIGGEGYTLYYPFPVTDMLFLSNSSNLSLIVSTTNGIYLSTDLGATWESLQFNIISSIITGISVSGGNLFISTWGEGVLEYPDFSLHNIPGTIKGDLNPGSTLLVNGLASSVNDSFSLIVPPGTYNLTVLSQGYARSYYINISPFEVYTVANITYPVTFTESGLPSGNWYVNITGQQSSGPIPSSTTTYSTSLQNGLYSYTVSTGNKEYKPSYNGSFDVNGSAVSQSVTFTEVTYTVTFTESGLSYGDWYVNISTSSQSFSEPYTSTSISFSEPNGTYFFTVATNYDIDKPSLSSGSFTVNGLSVFQSVNFSKLTYTVTFSESGLSAGTSWSVTLNGTTESSTTSTLTFTELNGTYSYTIGSVSGYIASPSSGSITVSGSNVSQVITFTPVTPTLYTITFMESGLPSGTSWSVTFNGNTETSTTNTISFTEPNGTYSFSISSINGYSVSPSSGSITVKGTNISQNITFTSVTTTTPPSSNDYLIYIIIAVVVIAAAIGVVVAMVGRKNKPSRQ